MSKINRRDILKGAACSPLVWTPPVVQSVILPVHASTSSQSGSPCPDTMLINPVNAICTTESDATLWTFEYDGCNLTGSETIPDTTDVNVNQILIEVINENDEIAVRVSTEDGFSREYHSCTADNGFDSENETSLNLTINGVPFVASWTASVTDNPSTVYIGTITVSPA